MLPQIIENYSLEKSPMSSRALDQFLLDGTPQELRVDPFRSATEEKEEPGEEEGEEEEEAEEEDFMWFQK